MLNTKSHKFIYCSLGHSELEGYHLFFYNQTTIECEKSGKLKKCFTKVSVAYTQDYADITLNTNNYVIYFTIGPLLDN